MVLEDNDSAIAVPGKTETALRQDYSRLSASTYAYAAATYGHVTFSPLRRAPPEG